MQSLLVCHHPGLTWLWHHSSCATILCTRCCGITPRPTKKVGGSAAARTAAAPRHPHSPPRTSGAHRSGRHRPSSCGKHSLRGRPNTGWLTAAVGIVRRECSCKAVAAPARAMAALRSSMKRATRFVSATTTQRTAKEMRCASRADRVDHLFVSAAAHSRAGLAGWQGGGRPVCSSGPGVCSKAAAVAKHSRRTEC